MFQTDFNLRGPLDRLLKVPTGHCRGASIGPQSGSGG